MLYLQPSHRAHTRVRLDVYLTIETPNEFWDLYQVTLSDTTRPSANRSWHVQIFSVS